MSVVFHHAANEAELSVCQLKSMRKDETIRKLLKTMFGTKVASL